MIIKIKTTSLRIGYICNNCAIFWTYLLIFICAINAIRVSFNKKTDKFKKLYVSVANIEQSTENATF